MTIQIQLLPPVTICTISEWRDNGVDQTLLDQAKGTSYNGIHSLLSFINHNQLDNLSAASITIRTKFLSISKTKHCTHFPHQSYYKTSGSYFHFCIFNTFDPSVPHSHTMSFNRSYFKMKLKFQLYSFENLIHYP